MPDEKPDRLIHNLLFGSILVLTTLIILVASFHFIRQLFDLPGAAYERAQEFAAYGKTQEAIQELRKAIQMKKDFPEANAFLGELYYKKKRYELAVKSFKDAIQGRGGNLPSALLGLSKSYFMLGRLDDATNVIQHALAQKPNFAGAVCMRGQIYEKEGKRVQALAKYKEAIRLNPRLGEAHLRAGLLYLKIKNRDAAEKEYLALLDRDGDLLYEWQEESERILNVKQKEQPLSEVPEESEGKTMPTLIAKAQSLQTSGALEEALDAYEEALDISPHNSTILLNLGLLYNARVRFDDAAKVLSEVLSLEPENAKAHCYLGQVFANQGNIDKAVESLMRALTLDPNMAEAHIALGIIYLNMGKDRAAVNLLERASKLSSSDPQAFYYFGIACDRLDKLEDAKDALRRVIALNPNYPDAYRQLWLTCQRDVMMERSYEYFKHFPYRRSYLIGVAFYRNAEFQEALAKFDEALAIDSASVEAKTAKAMCLIRLERLDDAIALLNEVLEKYPRFAPAKLALANGYLLKGDRAKYEELLQDLEKFFGRAPTSASAPSVEERAH
jgi:superkiller protein 3